MEDKPANNLKTTLQQEVNDLLQAQLRDWDLAARNYQGLNSIKRHTMLMDSGSQIDVQFNPERIYSSAAKVDPKSISERKCFLCLPHLPPQQKWVEYGEEYVILVNPFPIFQKHLTIPHRNHIDQRIRGRMQDMLSLARELDEFVIFYNGPRCGASAPDHFHFQAGNKGFMHIESEFGTLSKTLVKIKNNCRAWTIDNYLRHCLVIEGDEPDIICQWFEKALNLLGRIKPQPDEPMMNILTSWNSNHWRVFIFPRKLHRPWQFFEQGEDHILLSPASVDLGGVLITPREADHIKLNKENITDILKQVTLDKSDFDQLITEFTL